MMTPTRKEALYPGLLPLNQGLKTRVDDLIQSMFMSVPVCGFAE